MNEKLVNPSKKIQNQIEHSRKIGNPKICGFYECMEYRDVLATWMRIVRQQRIDHENRIFIRYIHECA